VKVLLTGASGLFGGYLEPALAARGATVVPVWHATRPVDGRGFRCDLTDERAATDLVEEVAPDVIVHGAALTDVDRCEAEPELADAINRRSTELLARAAEARGARLVFISTDSVFDGTRGSYTELDAPAPLNEYARSKLRAEAHALGTPLGVCFRTNFFGRSIRGHGLAEWLLRELGAGRDVIGFEDVVFSPLYCGDAATALAELALNDVVGVLHLGGDPINKYEFGVLVADAYGLDRSLVHPGSVAEVRLRAPRPLNTSLDSSAARSLLHSPLRDVEAAVAEMAASEPAAGRTLA
jgi:dTDP-4-dehydrorhamnose reductase